MSTYTTMQGDKWDLIAHKQLGSTSYVDKLMMLNPEYLDMYIFPSGIVLTLPEVDADAIDMSYLPPWKQVSG